MRRDATSDGEAQGVGHRLHNKGQVVGKLRRDDDREYGGRIMKTGLEYSE